MILSKIIFRKSAWNWVYLDKSGLKEFLVMKIIYFCLIFNLIWLYFWRQFNISSMTIKSAFKFTTLARQYERSLYLWSFSVNIHKIPLDLAFPECGRLILLSILTEIWLILFIFWQLLFYLIKYKSERNSQYLL